MYIIKNINNFYPRAIEISLASNLYHFAFHFSA